MTCTSRWIGTLTMTAVMALSAPAASPQSAGDQATPREDLAHGRATPPAGGDRPMAGMGQDLMAHMAAMDERVQMLVAEMHSFVGEPKITAMAALLTLLVERQSMMREHMMQMHERMMGRMMERMTSAAPPDEEPGLMCAPLP